VTTIFQRVLSYLKEGFRIFGENQSARRGAAIAFYTVTSIAPVLIIVIAVAGFVFGSEAATGAVFAQFRGLLGADAASLLQKAITSSASEKSAGTIATIISVVGLILTASGVFLELEDALNAIWETQPQKGLLNMARARIASLGLVIALGFILMVSLVIDTGIKAFSGVIDAYLPFGAVLLAGLTFLVSSALITLLCAAIYKFLPAKALPWRDILVAAAVTDFLFEIGKFLIGLYLGRDSTISSLGAAGALLGLLFWVYYSAQIFLFGGALTRAYSQSSQQAQGHDNARSFQGKASQAR
jgi:membrane protein